MKNTPSKEVLELLNKWESFEKWRKNVGLVLLLTTYLVLFLLWGVSMVVIK
mgnify:CR=1 FL=1